MGCLSGLVVLSWLSMFGNIDCNFSGLVVEVYTSALKLVRSMLPLPYLKVGHLIAPPVGSPTAPHCDWKLTQFVLNHEGLEQVELYADYDPKMVLPFLRSSQHYMLEKAYAICNKRDLVREQVFILGRMGNSKQALEVIINKLGDIEEAIEFANMQQYDEIWEELIKQCLDKPEMMTVVEALVGGTKFEPADNASSFPSTIKSLHIEGVAQNTTGSVFVPEVGSLNISAGLEIVSKSQARGLGSTFRMLVPCALQLECCFQGYLHCQIWRKLLAVKAVFSQFCEAREAQFEMTQVEGLGQLI